MPPKKTTTNNNDNVTGNNVVEPRQPKTTKKTTPKKQSTTSLPSAPTLDTKLFQPDNIKLIRALEKMTKTLEKLTKDQDEFNVNFAALSNYTEEEVSEMDYKLRGKNEECYNYLHELQKKYTEKQFTLENEFNQRTYDLETKYKQLEQELETEYTNKSIHEMSSCLQKYNRSVIETFKYNELLNELELLRTKLDDLKKELETQMHKELTARLQTAKLQHQVETSNMTAQIENQKREIEVLNDTIQTLKSEVQAQRELTHSVANAGQKQLTQNFGK